MDEIVREFLVESHENLDQIDVDLVALERDPESRERLARVFRAVHTIKGTSGFLGLPVLEGVAHAGETLLASLRDGDLHLSTERASLLLATVDAIREILTSVEAGTGEGPRTFEDLVSLLHRSVADEPVLVGEPAPAVEPAPAPQDLPAPAGVVTAPTAPVGSPVPGPGSTPVRAVPEPVEPVAAEDDEREVPGRRGAAESSVRVDVAVLDSLMRLVGELVLTRNQLSAHHGGQSGADQPAGGAAVAAAPTGAPGDHGRRARGSMMQPRNLGSSDLQDAVMKARMQPVDTVWAKFPRVVRDLATACGKDVSLTMLGRDTELDRGLVEAVRDPLTHLVRNAVDHGIETPAERVAAGKPAGGALVLRASHESGRVVIELSDDGAGLDPAAITAKAVERGIITPAQAASMSAHDAHALVFRPGFSTAAAVTNVSGRGVGMDVVKTNIEAIGGTVELSSTPGRGTTVRLTLPLTLAIVPALIVVVGEQRYAVPQTLVRELVAVHGGGHVVEDVAGVQVLRLRERLLTLVDGRTLLEAESGPPGAIVVLDVDGRVFGLVVDEVQDTEEIVVSSLGEHLAGTEVFSGATILGDGAVALILDGTGLSGLALTGEQRADLLADAGSEDRSREDARRLVVVRADGERHLALPLDAVTRLEDLDGGSVERLGEGWAVRYRGGIMPLVEVASVVGGRPGRTPGGGADGSASRAVVVVSRGEHPVGLVVDAIVDIADEDPSVAPQDGRRGPGVVGGAVVGGRLVELLDLEAALRCAGPVPTAALLEEAVA
ncbi:chemotaxis protein CheA [Phycicoccus sp. MQZ13P-5]|uniref:histidine kinase n=2 Tax=Phycicoccus sonneratiae TaxID=2807628 RepID=A0ABS2CPM8_9MICO|nr:chemotaxis protein CheA [Phycicoccus sonneraticus]